VKTHMATDSVVTDGRARTMHEYVLMHTLARQCQVDAAQSPSLLLFCCTLLSADALFSPVQGTRPLIKHEVPHAHGVPRVDTSTWTDVQVPSERWFLHARGNSHKGTIDRHPKSLADAHEFCDTHTHTHVHTRTHHCAR